MPDLQTCIKLVEGGGGGDAAVLYRSELLSILELETVEQREEAFRLFAMQALFEETQKSDNEDQSKARSVNTILRMAFQSQISRNRRHEASVNNGEKGGRPQTVDRTAVWRLREKGLSQRQIADELNCAPKTVQRILKEEKPVSTSNVASNENSVQPAQEQDGYQWANDRTPNDHPFVREALEQGGQNIPDDPNDLPF